MKVGMLGLGAMGLPMAKNLLHAGLAVFGYNRSSEKPRQELARLGGVVCEKIEDVAQESDLILASLPNAQVVESVMLGEGGVLRNCRKGCCVVDMSSVSPAVSQKIFLEAKEKGVHYADAPVSGGVEGAAGGNLTIMFGGEEEVWQKVLPVLRILGKKLVYVGNIGSGDAAKLVNNLLLGCNMAAVAEALALGRRLGLSLETMRDIIGESSGNSYVFSAKMDHYILPDRFEGGFATDLQYKDLNLALEAGRDVIQPLPMAAAAAQIFQVSRQMGNGRKDISAAVHIWEYKNTGRRQNSGKSNYSKYWNDNQR